MSLDQYAAIGEFVGGIAVVFSLIWIAMQIRQNTRGTRSSTLATNVSIWTNTLMQVSTPHNSEAYALGAMGSSKMTPTQLLRFTLICKAWFNSMENQWYQFNHGTLDADIYKGYESSVSNELLAYPGIRTWWQIHKEYYSPGFSAYIDELILSVEQVSPMHLYEQWQEHTATENGLEA